MLFRSSLLPSIVGLARARFLMFTGATIGAAEAADWGLILKVVPRQRLEHEVDEIIEMLTLASPDSIAFYKRRVNGPLGRQARPADLYDLIRSPNAREGVAAFVDKRTPRWMPPPSTSGTRPRDSGGPAQIGYARGIRASDR